MKARVIKEPYRMANLKIGDVVEIVPGMETDAEGIWNVPAGKLVLCKKEDGTFTYASLLDMKIVDCNSVDWSDFRREAAKEILAGMMSHPRVMYGISSYGSLVFDAIEYADELIKQLKEDKQ